MRSTETTDTIEHISSSSVIRCKKNINCKPHNIHGIKIMRFLKTGIPGRVAQSVTCLVTDTKLTAGPGVASSIPARSHTFVEIDHEIISTVILLPFN